MMRCPRISLSLSPVSRNTSVSNRSTCAPRAAPSALSARARAAHTGAGAARAGRARARPRRRSRSCPTRPSRACACPTSSPPGAPPHAAPPPPAAAPSPAPAPPPAMPVSASPDMARGASVEGAAAAPCSEAAGGASRSCPSRAAPEAVRQQVSVPPRPKGSAARGKRARRAGAGQGWRLLHCGGDGAVGRPTLCLGQPATPPVSTAPPQASPLARARAWARVLRAAGGGWGGAGQGGRAHGVRPLGRLQLCERLPLERLYAPAARPRTHITPKPRPAGGSAAPPGTPATGLSRASVCTRERRAGTRRVRLVRGLGRDVSV